MAFLDHYGTRSAAAAIPINGSNGSTRFGHMPMPPQPRNRGDYDSDLSSMTMKRSYDAAIPTAGTADWLAWSTSGSFEVLYAWRRVCYLARDLERNNPHARAFLRELGLNVIGPNGIRLQPRVKNLKGPNLNEKLNTAISEAWTDFRTKGLYEVTGQYSGILADNLALRGMARDGGCLLKFHRGYRGNKYRFAVQLLEVDALDLWYTKILDEQRIVTEGVEVDGFGKPINYHLLKYSEADLMANTTIGQRIVVPARDMVHAWLPERLTSVRGISWFASVLLKLRMLDKFEEATAIAKRTTAAKMGFFERTVTAEKYEGQGELPTGEIINEVNPGSFEELPTGVTFKPFDPGKSEDNYHDFRKAILRSVASGLGPMYNVLANDLESVNYSTARFGRDLEVMFWRYLQNFWIETVLQPIFRAWLESWRLYGGNDCPVDFSQMDMVEKSMLWRPRGFPYIDPQKDVEASTGAICFGLSTHTRELAEQGLDIEEVFQEMAHDKDLALKYGLTFIDPKGRNPFISTQEDPAAVPGVDTAAEDAKVTVTAPASAVKPVAKPAAPSAKNLEPKSGNYR
jgi:lambda family phage portal protein